MNIVVLCGGNSTEREVSINSGSMVCEALRKKNHNAILMDVYFGLEDIDIFEKSASEYDVESVKKNIQSLSDKVSEDRRSFFGNNVIEICQKADIVFMALHGKNGEDGKCQAAFDLYGIKYTGSGHLASAIGMDKGVTKQIFYVSFPGKKIVIVGGGTVGCETADYLAPLVNDLSPANRDVTVIEMTKTLAANEGGAGRAVLITRMLSKGVHVLTEAKVTEITEDTISYEKDGEVHTITGADTLVLAMGYRPNTKLADDLAAAGVATHVLGDASKCGNIRDAIGDGYKAACEL